MSRPAPVLSHHAKLAGDDLASTASLREWYAGLALQGLLASGDRDTAVFPDSLADGAVTCADALIAALAGGKEPAK